LQIEADVENFARRVPAVAADSSRLATMIMTLNLKVVVRTNHNQFPNGRPFFGPSHDTTHSNSNVFFSLNIEIFYIRM
jgi:hypothetical protein